MTALAALDPAYKPGRVEEMALWREANLIFMGDGNAGCGPFGLANAALTRHFNAEVYGHKIEALFAGWTRSANEAEIQGLIDDHDRERFLAAGGAVHDRPLSIDLLKTLKDEGRQLLVLVGTGLHGHWVLADAITDETVEVLDPYKATAAEIAEYAHHTDSGAHSMPHDTFLKWASYGPKGSSAVIALSKASTTPAP
jgi:hypothetical protein